MSSTNLSKTLREDPPEVDYEPPAKKLKKSKKSLSQVPVIPCPVDSLADLAFIPEKPLPAKNFAMYVVGAPGSGKTNLWVAMLTSQNPLYYRGLFNMIALVSASKDTLPKKVTTGKQGLPPEQQYMWLDDKVLIDIIVRFRKPKKNGNNLLILDDVIKDITRTRSLSKIFLNRRHATYDSTKERSGGLSIMTMSQKYNLLPLEFRVVMSHVVLFKTENASELKAIKNELMSELNPEEQDKLLKKAWGEKYSFLLVDTQQCSGQRYFIKFEPYVF
ncbi:MAG: hypothetical protein JKY09_08155 [Crocinitomicaceae bacterium]|nr:hypothetical protein [Crocinitomicaceae bacterium]